MVLFLKNSWQSLAAHIRGSCEKPVFIMKEPGPGHRWLVGSERESSERLREAPIKADG